MLDYFMFSENNSAKGFMKYSHTKTKQFVLKIRRTNYLLINTIALLVFRRKKSKNDNFGLN